MCRIAELLRPDKAGGKNELIENIDKVHTTKMGIDRIRRNLGLGDVDAAAWCKSRILDKNADITRQGKNWYVRTDDCVITVNASSYTIITAHESIQ
jgi:hypothetical protein